MRPRSAGLGAIPGARSLDGARRGRRGRAKRRRRRLFIGLLSALTVVLVVTVAARAPGDPVDRRRLVHRTVEAARAVRAARVVATSPAPGAAGVAPTTKVVLALSRPIAPGVPPPRLTPAVAGAWSACGHDELCFTPSVPFPLGTTETVDVPLAAQRARSRSLARQDADRHGARSATAGLASTAAATSATKVTRRFELHFSTATASVGLAQVLLAQLRYLPLELPSGLTPVVSSHPSPPGSSQLPAGTASSAGAGSEAASSARGSAPVSQRATDADPALALTWRYDDLAPSVQALWQPGVDNTMTKGAIVQFERVHGLEDGSYPPYATTLTAALWQDLVTSAMAGATDPHPYTVAEVSEAQPERLTLWSDGADELTTLVNTGVPGGATPTGAFFVYLRYVSHTMHGYTVTGKPYVYPNVPDVNYFSGNFAIHGFPRAAYGFPQSQGCVEVPLAEAPLIYRDLDYGSLVVIS